ncbi:TIR domain-containing protein [Agrobacterium rhizogenes]|nr:TIR domain-containing protein [Rhizobium rhizogenes]
MLDFLRIHVLWEASSAAAGHAAEVISRHFDGIGMEREGVAFRVPVRFRSVPWDTRSMCPYPVDLDRAQHNAVVLLFDDYMSAERVTWDSYVRELRSTIDARGDVDVYIPFGSPTGETPLDSDATRNTHYAVRAKWHQLPSNAARDTRLLLHLVLKLREHLRGALGKDAKTEPLFVSHAKADGDATARAIVDYVNNSANDVPLETFYDAMELSPGDDFEERFESEISRGTLLAIVSDIYDTRPWCVYELTTAKRYHRPIVLADVGKVRISRTYPYGANLPRVRLTPAPENSTWVEPLLVEALSEGLRCDLFVAHAEQVLAVAKLHGTIVLPRPPELLDIVELPGHPCTIVYPAPPLGRIESDILRKALARIAPGSIALSLGEVK